MTFLGFYVGTFGDVSQRFTVCIVCVLKAAQTIFPPNVGLRVNILVGILGETMFLVIKLIYS